MEYTFLIFIRPHYVYILIILSSYILLVEKQPSSTKIAIIIHPSNIKLNLFNFSNHPFQRLKSVKIVFCTVLHEPIIYKKLSFSSNQLFIWFKINYKYLFNLSKKIGSCENTFKLFLGLILLKSLLTSNINVKEKKFG